MYTVYCMVCMACWTMCW